MLSKTSLASIGTLFLDTPGACAGATPRLVFDRGRAPAVPAATRRRRVTAPQAFGLLDRVERVALASIGAGVAVLLVAGIASLAAHLA